MTSWKRKRTRDDFRTTQIENIKRQSLEYFITIVFRDIPTSFLVGFLVLFGGGTVLFLAFFGWRRGAKRSAGLLLLEYMILLLAMAVLTRTVQSAQTFDFTPFWSYRAIIQDGKNALLTQNIANVGAFVPIGLLLGCAFGRMKWWKVLAFGGGFSLLIEVLQFVFKRGFAEFDDVFHNVLGCAIGYGVYVLAVSLKHIGKQHPAQVVLRGK